MYTFNNNYLNDKLEMNVSNEVNFIWSIANILRGPYLSEDYKNVIIPMVLIRRFECTLEPTKNEVLSYIKKCPEYSTKDLMAITGADFFNISDLSLKTLPGGRHLAAEFKRYIGGFSDNIKEIMINLDFYREIDKMERFNRLDSVISSFSRLDLGIESVDSIKMGYIFEELIRKFSENSKAGDHYTGKDIIRTMVSLILSEGCEDIAENDKEINILDQAAGTGGILTTAYDYIKSINNTAHINLYSQEINPESYSMCLAEMLIRGQDTSLIKLQDTMQKDCFPETKMRFVLENPPFGQAWGGKGAYADNEYAVMAEAEKKSKGRFPGGTPAFGDMQLLFMQSAIDKMDKNNGRAAVITNDSPLFSGVTSSGESQIRRWILKNDYVEAIVRLGNGMFYNTDIMTYIWILSKNKRKERVGKIQLIDAAELKKPLLRSLGDKRFEISNDDVKTITKLYTDFKENEYSHIYDNSYFIQKEYTIMEPLQKSYGISEERISLMIKNGSLDSLYSEYAVNKLYLKVSLNTRERNRLDQMLESKPLYDSILKRLRENITDKIYNDLREFNAYIRNILNDVLPTDLLYVISKRVAEGLGVTDDNAPIQKDRSGNTLYDVKNKYIVVLPSSESIKKYMEKEVLPYKPGSKAFFEETRSKGKIKTGAKILFSQCFYKPEPLPTSGQISEQFWQLEKELEPLVKNIFGESKE